MVLMPYVMTVLRFVWPYAAIGVILKVLIWLIRDAVTSGILQGIRIAQDDISRAVEEGIRNAKDDISVAIKEGLGTVNDNEWQ
jgi:hypothetical protein